MLLSLRTGHQKIRIGLNKYLRQRCSAYKGDDPDKYNKTHLTTAKGLYNAEGEYDPLMQPDFFNKTTSLFIIRPDVLAWNVRY